MNILSSIFSPSIANKAVDAVIDAGDALVYTDEEKAKALQLATETKLKMLPLYEPFKLAQRLIAITFTINFILAFWAGVLIYFVFGNTQLKEYLALVTAFQLGWIMLAIISFYFGGGFINSFKGVKNVK